MEKENDKPAPGGLKKDPALFRGMVEFKLKRGVSFEEIVSDLVEKGLTPAQAKSLTDQVRVRVEALAASEAVDLVSAALALVGALVAAALGAGLWLLADNLTGRHLDLMAVPAGALVGLGARLVSARRGILIQVTAAVVTVLCIGTMEYFLDDAALSCGPVSKSGMEMIKDFSCVGIKTAAELARDIIWVGPALILSLWIPKRKKKN
jgi:hypothetical protein